MVARLLRAGISLFSLLAAASAWGGPLCISPNDFRLGEFKERPSLSIRLFGLRFKPEVPMRAIEDLRLFLVGQLRVQLERSKFYANVRVLAADEEAASDLVLSGDLTDLQLGNSSFGWASLLTQGALNEPSVVGLEGMIGVPGAAEPATTFACRVGGFRGSATGKLRASAAGIAGYLRKTYSDMLKPPKKKGRR